MKIHEYNEMMAYLTRPSYVSGGRVGFKRGSGNPISITDSILGKFDNFIKNTNLTLKEIGRKFNYTSDLRSDSFIVKEYEKKFGKIPEQRFRAYKLTADSPQVVEGIKLFEEGMSKKAIARKFGIDRKALRNYFHQFKPEYIGEENISKGGKYNWKKVRDKRMRSLITELKTQPGGKEIFNQMKSKLDGIWSKNDEILKMTDDQIWNNKDFKKAMNLDVKDLTIGKGLKFDRYADLTKSEYVDKVKALAKNREFFQPEHFIPIKNKNVASLLPENIHTAVGKVGGQMEELKKHVKNKGKYSSEVVKFLESQGIPITKAPGPIKKAFGLVGKATGKALALAAGPLEAGFMGAEAEQGKSPLEVIASPLMLQGAARENRIRNIMGDDSYQEFLQHHRAEADPVFYGEGEATGKRLDPNLETLRAMAVAQVQQEDDARKEEARQFNLKSDETMFNQGGRVGLAKGPKDPGRRLFIKGVGAAAMIPIVGKYFKLAAPATKAAAQYAGPILEGLGTKLKWVQLLAKRLWNEGDDITETASTVEREIVKAGKLESGDDVVMFYNKDTNNVRFSVTGKETGEAVSDTTSGAYNKQYDLEYKAPEVIDEGKHAGKKTKSEVQVVEEYPRQVTPEDVELDVIDSPVDSALSDLTELEAFAKKKTVKQIHKKKGTKPKDVAPDYEPPDWYDLDYDID